MAKYQELLSAVHNRGTPSPAFLDEMIAWARTAPDALFASNTNLDIFSKVRVELGPWEGPLHRKAVMLEVMRVLAGFESSWRWKEGVDSSRRTATTKDNAEAGAWQVSWDARKLDASLAKFLADAGISDGLVFQQRMKADRPLAMSFIASLLRIDVKNFERIANGPVRRGAERQATWPDRPNLWPDKETIYPWLSRAAVKEFVNILS